MRNIISGFVACGLVLAGCATSNVPRGARLVGGGLHISYEAPAAGTVLLVERTSGRIVATESLAEGATFHFGPDWSASKQVLLSMFGPTNAVDNGEFPAVPTNTLFQLYFVPVQAK